MIFYENLLAKIFFNVVLVYALILGLSNKNFFVIGVSLFTLFVYIVSIVIYEMNNTAKEEEKLNFLLLVLEGILYGCFIYIVIFDIQTY